MWFGCRDKPVKELSFGTRKKVRFDPNVEIYEYVSCNDEASDSLLESDGGGKNGEEENIETSSQSRLFSENSWITLSSGYYPLNCSEYDELDCEDSDLDDIDDHNDNYDGLHEDDGSPVPICGLCAGEVKAVGSNPYARDRSVSLNPLLVPVENLTQWKALKAKGAPPLTTEKENFMGLQDKRVKSETRLEKVKAVGSNPYARDRSVSLNLLLVPIENLSQWKALKAKEEPAWTPGKENFMGLQDKRVKYETRLEKVKAVGFNPYVRDRSVSLNPLLIPVENLTQWKALKSLHPSCAR